MTRTDQNEQLHVTTVEIEGRRLSVSVTIEFDGVEHIGHLWYADEEWDDEEVRDHGAIPGQSPEEVLAHARQLSQAELALRFQRAQADKRRFHGLRQITEDVLSRIRHLNAVAISMRAGLLDLEEAAAEIDETEKRLHEMVGQLRHFAGVAS